MEQKPLVSILVAARNEEHFLPNCLRALEKLDYPKGKLQILVGDDNSEDRTLLIAKSFAKGKPNAIVVPIRKQVAGLKSKANVLAQLMQKATGDWVFVTDADTNVPPSWIEGMLFKKPNNTHIITGVTVPKGAGLFSSLQAVDWLYNLLLIKEVTDSGFPLTAMGNNMAFSAEAYEAVGGYENIPYSPAEDYALFKAITNKGFGFKQLVNQEVLANTRPAKTVNEWMHQRLRWMQGAMQLPVLFKAAFFLQALWLPIMLVLAMYNPLLSIAVWATKIFLQSFYIAFHAENLGLKFKLLHIVLYEFYVVTFAFILAIRYLFFPSFEWKGRRYRGRNGN